MFSCRLIYPRIIALVLEIAFWYKVRLFISYTLDRSTSSEVRNMSRVCQVTGKRPMSGNNVSHAKNRTRRRFLPNLQTRRFWLAAEKRWVKLKVSTKGLRIIDKLGIEHVLNKIRVRKQNS